MGQTRRILIFSYRNLKRSRKEFAVVELEMKNLSKSFGKNKAVKRLPERSKHGYLKHNAVKMQ